MIRGDIIIKHYTILNIGLPLKKKSFYTNPINKTIKQNKNISTINQLNVSLNTVKSVITKAVMLLTSCIKWKMKKNIKRTSMAIIKKDSSTKILTKIPFLLLTFLKWALLLMKKKCKQITSFYNNTCSVIKRENHTTSKINKIL